MPGKAALSVALLDQMRALGWFRSASPEPKA
jgi:hypothetical protein